MSAVFRIFDPSRLLALAAAGTIMGCRTNDIPDLPLTCADVDLPVPLVLPAMPAIIRPRARAIDEARDLALHLHRGRQHLCGWDCTLVREVVRWRAEPSAYEADEIARLAEEMFWRAQDEGQVLKAERRL